MVVGDDELHAFEAARLQPDKEVTPGRAALATGHLDGENLAPSIPVNPDCDQHGLPRRPVRDFAQYIDVSEAMIHVATDSLLRRVSH